MDWLEPLRQDTERIRQETQKIREETERIREENRKLKESIRKLKKINTQKLLQEITGSKMNQLTPEQIETLELAFSSYPENFPMTTEQPDKTPEQLFEEILMDRNPKSFMDLLFHPDLDKLVEKFDQTDDLSKS